MSADSENPDLSLEPARLLKRVERERAARKEAERLLEEQSRALFESNRRVEAAFSDLKLKSDQTRAFLEHMPIGVIIATDDGTVESVNHLAMSQFGTTSKMARGLPLRQLLPHFSAGDRLIGDAAFDPFNPLQTEAVTLSGQKFPCEVVAARMGSGQDTRIIWMVRDVRQRLDAEKRRAQLEAELRQAHRLESLGTMAGGIAHELNTPIQFVTDNTNFLDTAFAALLAAVAELKGKVPEDVARAIDTAHDLAYLADEVPQAIAQSREGLARVAEIVLAIKRFSHPGGLSKGFNDLNQIIQTASTVTKNQWKYVADLELDLVPDLPLIQSNANELNQVFLNLLVNAAHAIEENVSATKPGKITIATRTAGDAVECRVSDTGVGIKPEHLARIFDLFFTTKPPGRGTGQGLAVVHNVVQSHGGKIQVESKPGVGTTFVLTLPINGVGAASPEG